MNATAWHSATLQPHRFSIEPRMESFDNAAGETVYQLILTKLSNGDKVLIRGSRAEWDDLFRQFTMILRRLQQLPDPPAPPTQTRHNPRTR